LAREGALAFVSLWLAGCGTTARPPTAGDELGAADAADVSSGHPSSPDAGGAGARDGAVASGDASATGDADGAGSDDATAAGDAQDDSSLGTVTFDAGPCVPSTATAACPGRCGPISDGCGGTLQCGFTCASGEICDLTTGLCATPRSTCADLGVQCGDVDDDCGQTVHCGACGPAPGTTNPRTCDQTSHTCVACPSPLDNSLCPVLGIGCGTLSICGQTIQCGGCPNGQVCDPIAKTCGAVTTYSCQGKCGYISDGDGPSTAAAARSASNAAPGRSPTPVRR
jgi:hypothetical protein